jgi:hypothetical protein
MRPSDIRPSDIRPSDMRPLTPHPNAGWLAGLSGDQKEMSPVLNPERGTGNLYPLFIRGGGDAEMSGEF